MQAEAQTMMDTKHSAISVIKGGPTSTNHTLPMNGKTLGNITDGQELRNLLLRRILLWEPSLERSNWQNHLLLKRGSHEAMSLELVRRDLMFSMRSSHSSFMFIRNSFLS